MEVHHLLTDAEFVEIYTLAQVAPGPNAMYVTSDRLALGWMEGRGRDDDPTVGARCHSHAASRPSERALSQCSDARAIRRG